MSAMARGVTVPSSPMPSKEDDEPPPRHDDLDHNLDHQHQDHDDNDDDDVPPSSHSAAAMATATAAAEEKEEEEEYGPGLGLGLVALLRSALNNPDQVTAMISNYSTSYNAVNVAIVIPVLTYSMQQHAAASSAVAPDETEPYSAPGMSMSPFPFGSSSSSSSLSSFSSIARRLLLLGVGGVGGEKDEEEEEEEDDSIVASSLLAGMIFGQLIGGYLGDVLGRRNAMMLVMALQIGGSLGSAIFVSTTGTATGTGGGGEDYYHDESGGGGDGGGGLNPLEQLAVWRFILGIGAGGVYPLAAVMSAETATTTTTGRRRRGIGGGGSGDDGNPSSVRTHGEELDGWNNDEEEEEEEDPHRRNDAGVTMQDGGGYHAPLPASSGGGGGSTGRHSDDNAAATIGSFQRIALTFSTQGLGFITVPLLAYPMLVLGMDADAIWRVLLGAGALPGMAVLYLRLCSSGSMGKGAGGHANEEGEDVVENGEGHVVDINNGRHHRRRRMNVSIDDDDGMTTPTNKSLELPASSIEGNDEGGGGGSDSACVQTAIVSTLFGDDVTNSSNSVFDRDAGQGHHRQENENEMALVDNSHLDIIGGICNGDNGDVDVNAGERWLVEEDEVHARGEDATCVPPQNVPRGLWESIRAEPNLGRKFAGTAGTWFLFDVLFYGNTLFEPLVLEAAFGSRSSEVDGYELLQTTVRDSLVISLLSLPGYFVTVLLIGQRTCASCCSVRRSSSSSTTRCGSVLSPPSCHQTPAYIQMQGFFFMFVLYIVIGLYWTALSDVQWLLLVLYAGTFFFANYGPNTTTFLLPSVTYSEECRSTLNGVSAAMGKMGALVGASVFSPAADEWGESVVMVCCGCVSLAAWTLTRICLGGRGR